MTKRWTLFLAICAFHVALNAQVNRSFVASYGFDANDCSRANPCRSFAAAILVTNAGGEIIALDSAGYGPSLNITQAISVIAPTGIYAGMTTTSGSAITINAPAATVVLRGLYLNSVGGMKGVEATNVGYLYIDNCVVSGFQSNGIEFNGSSSHLFVSDTTSRGNGHTINHGGGIVVIGADATHHAFASIENCRLEANGSGAGVAADAGVAATPFSEVTVRHSIAVANTRGFQAAEDLPINSFIRLTIEDCVSADNVVGVFGSNDPDAKVRVSNTVITHNTLYAIEAQGSNIFSRGNNTVIDNNTGETFSGTFDAR